MVPDRRQARQAATLALFGITAVNWSMLLMGFAAISLIAGRAPYALQGISLKGRQNMAFLHLTHFLGGGAFFGFFLGVLVMTIFAAVTAVVLSAASSLVLDFYRGLTTTKTSDANDVFLTRIAIALVCLVAGAFALAAHHSNIALLSAIAHAFAASVNFPLIALTLYWPGLTRRGALLGGAIGFSSALIATVLGPLVWCDMLGFKSPIYQNHYPTILSVPSAFLAAWLGSIFDKRGADSRRELQEDPSVKGA
jgi:cation/acetate symporter